MFKKTIVQKQAKLFNNLINQFHKDYICREFTYFIQNVKEYNERYYHYSSLYEDLYDGSKEHTKYLDELKLKKSKKILYEKKHTYLTNKNNNSVKGELNLTSSQKQDMLRKITFLTIITNILNKNKLIKESFSDLKNGIHYKKV